MTPFVKLESKLILASCTKVVAARTFDGFGSVASAIVRPGSSHTVDSCDARAVPDQMA